VLGDCTRGFAKRVLKEREGGGGFSGLESNEKRKGEHFCKKIFVRDGFLLLDLY
jgi:hypothetical protein